MYAKLMNFLVLGIANSGVSVSKLLLSKGARVYIYDNSTNEKTQKLINELVSLGCTFVENVDEILSEIDVLVLSPGVSVLNEIAIKAKSQGIRIIGEIELASYYINNPIVAVTGTNGKTTTCSLISHTLSKNGVNNKLVGNVGTPLSTSVGCSEEDILVVEVSSYQLETTCRFTPHIACILNITEDHLERHFTMENYIFLKSKLILTLKESEFAILNYDDENVRNLAIKTKAKIVWISQKERVDGVYLSNGAIYCGEEQVIKVEDLTVKGSHNIENVLCSVAVLKLLGLENQEIVDGLTTFKGVKHRIEQVAKVNGITFYNDSKATNPDATIKAINALEGDLVIILGGYDKGLDYDELFSQISSKQNVKGVVLTGQTALKMYEFAKNQGVKNLVLSSNFETAIKLAYAISKENYKVLLSPATSSFDEFTGYEERGEKFIEIATSFK